VARHRIVLNAVRSDVEEGLGRYFDVVRVDFLPPTTTRPLRNRGGSYAVMWECECRDNTAFPDLLPSGRSFTIEGVSIVRRVRRQWEYRRLVDWAGVTGDLGESRHRRSLDADAADRHYHRT
jgi:hypothetical protein